MRYLLTILFAATVSTGCNKKQTGTPVPQVSPFATYDTRAVGVSAHDFLSSDRYKAINLEIVYVKEHKLPAEVVNSAVAFLNKYCNKPGGIKVIERQIGLQGGKLYTNDLMTVEKVYRTQYEKQGNKDMDTLGLFILVTEADYYESGILGVAYKNTALAIFDGIITENSGIEGGPDRNTILSTVFKHELGHLLGLVNAGSPMQSGHLDASHGKHCSNRACLMHYKMQTSEIRNAISGNSIPGLDADCEVDLKANGGK